jgi:hypothetical protein
MAPEEGTPDKMESKVSENPVPVRDILLTTFTVLHDKAFAFMGLLMHMETGDVREDLNEAKLAIEGMNALLPLIKPHLSEKQLMEVTLAVTNAQLNYARKVGRSEKEAADPDPAHPERDSE